MVTMGQDWIKFYPDTEEDILTDMLLAKGEEAKIMVYVDADHAGDPDRRSYMGNISFVWGGPIAWDSKKIRSVYFGTRE